MLCFVLKNAMNESLRFSACGLYYKLHNVSEPKEIRPVVQSTAMSDRPSSQQLRASLRVNRTASPGQSLAALVFLAQRALAWQLARPLQPQHLISPLTNVYV